MPTAEAHIETERASRYLAQLCQHASRIKNMGGLSRHRRPAHVPADAHARPDVPTHVEWSEIQGTIGFAEGTVTLQAGPGTLILRAEAAGEENLRRIQDIVTADLDRFGKRDHLAVTWQRP
jgi:hypothetical protein